MIAAHGAISDRPGSSVWLPGWTRCRAPENPAAAPERAVAEKFERFAMFEPSSMLQALHADGPAQDRVEKMSLYGWLIGRWEATLVDHLLDGSIRTSEAEIHFDWVLEGRAIQDVWISPPRSARPAHHSKAPRLYGTTLRIYDPRTDTWRILWINPASQAVDTMVACKRGDDIVQEGKSEDGAPIRWSFTEITPESFHWLGEQADCDGRWRLAAEFFARRVVGG